MSEHAVIVMPLSEDDGGGYVGLAPDLQGCMSDGKNRAEALENTEQAMREWIELKVSQGLELPHPGVSIERSSAQRKSLMNALKAMMSYLDEADGRIAELEKALEDAVDGISNNWERNLPLFDGAGTIYRARRGTTH